MSEVKRNIMYVWGTIVILCLVIMLKVDVHASDSSIVSSGKCGENATWSLTSDGTFTVSGTGDMYDWDYHYDIDDLPEWDTYLDEDGNKCEGNPNIKKIVIEDGITHIGDSVFACCSNLEQVDIGKSVTTIGIRSFYSTKLEEIIIPGNVKSVGEYAFAFATLKKVTFSEGVESIDKAAFWGDTNLEEVTIPTSIKVIGYKAFASTKWMSEQTDEDGYLIVNHILLKGPVNVENVVVPEGVTSIQGNGFGQDALDWEETNTETITIPDTVTYIGEDAFLNSRASVISLSKNLAYIGESAFYGCSNMESLDIPATVTEIGDGAFSSCKKLDKISVDADNKVYDSRDNCNAIIETATNKLVQGIPNTVIPSSVTAIGNSAFEGAAIEKIELSNNVTSIGERAFCYCDSLSEVTLSDNITSIGEYAFYGNAIEKIHLSDKITRIENGTFSHCSRLSSIVLPDDVDYIGDYAFDDCEELGNVTLPSKLKYIGECAFFGCGNITTVSIPETVEEIGGGAFLYCENIEEVEVLNLKKITAKKKSGIFGYDCPKLKVVNFYNCDFGPNVNAHIYELKDSNKFQKENWDKEYDYSETVDLVYNRFLDVDQDIEIHMYAGSKNNVINGIKVESPESESKDTSNTETTEATKSTEDQSVTEKNTVTPPTVNKIKSLKVKSAKKALNISWKKTSGVAGYQLQVSTKSSFKGAKTINVKKSKNSYKAKKLKSKKKYYVRIRSYKTYQDENGKTQKVYGKWVKTSKKTK